MRFKLCVLAGVAALALAACGKKDGASAPAAAAAGGPAAQVSAASPLESPYRIENGKAVDVDALFALFSEGDKPTYASAEFDPALGATVVKDLHFVERNRFGADGEAVVVESKGVTVERAELYGVDMDAINRVKAGAAAIDAPFEKIFEKVRFFGVRPDAGEEGGETLIGAIEFDQLRLRHGGFPDDENDNASRFFNSFDLGGLYFKDLAVKAPENDAGSFSFLAPDLRFVGVGGGKLSAFLAKDFEYTMAQAAGASLAQSMGPAAGAVLSGPLRGFIAPDNQRVTMKSVEWRGIDLSGLMGYGVKGEKPPLTATNLVNLGAMKVLDAKTFIAGKRAASVAETTISATEFTGVVPSKVRSETKGAEYDFTAYVPEGEEQAIAILKKHGLDDVKGAGTLDWDWDSAKGGAAFKTAFDAKGLADFELTFDLSGLEIAKIATLKEAGEKEAVMKVGSFRGFYFKLADEKLLDAIFDISAIEMGGTGADLRQSAPAMVRLSGAAAAATNPRIAESVEAIANFLGLGGTIEFSAKPKAPVPLQAIAATGQTAPDTVPDLIDLKVTHTKP